MLTAHHPAHTALNGVCHQGAGAPSVMQAATAECLAAQAEHSDDNVVAAAQDSVRAHFDLMTQVPTALSQSASE